MYCTFRYIIDYHSSRVRASALCVMLYFKSIGMRLVNTGALIQPYRCYCVALRCSVPSSA